MKSVKVRLFRDDKTISVTGTLYPAKGKVTFISDGMGNKLPTSAPLQDATTKLVLSTDGVSFMVGINEVDNYEIKIEGISVLVKSFENSHIILYNDIYSKIS